MSPVVADATPRLNMCPKCCSHPERGKNTVLFFMCGATTCNRLRLSVVGFMGTISKLAPHIL